MASSSKTTFTDEERAVLLEAYEKGMKRTSSACASAIKEVAERIDKPPEVIKVCTYVGLVNYILYVCVCFLLDWLIINIEKDMWSSPIE